MKQQHGKYDIKNFDKGVNTDVSKELLPNDGSHVDALNMRSGDTDGYSSAKRKIKGAVSLYPAVDNRWFNPATLLDMDNYVCMMSQEVNGKIVEIWAHRSSRFGNPIDADKLAFVRIEGVICLASENLPVFVRFPLQYDKNESVLGGEIYVTDFKSKPFVLDVEDMYINGVTAPTLKYFDDFIFDKYALILSGNELHKIQFIKTSLSATPYTGAIQIGSDAGLPVGYYAYAYRYKTVGGDTTSWSPVTEMIPVVQNIKTAGIDLNPPFKHEATRSKEADIAAPSPYSNVFKVRVDNRNGYSSIEIRRDEWRGENGTYSGIEVIHEQDISKIEDTKVFTFQDHKIAGTAITIEEGNLSANNIEAAKCIRFHNERLYLMNIKKTAKDVNSVLDMTTANGVYPTIQKLGQTGYNDTYNIAMYKSYMRGERYGFAIVFFDNGGNPTYGAPIPNSSNYKFPNRRESLPLEIKSTSYLGASYATTVDVSTGAEDYVYEVFDLADATSRGGGLYYDITDSNNCFLAPTQQDDINNNDTFAYQNPNVTVTSAFTGGNVFDPIQQTYNPKGFNPNYFALGGAIDGINIPNNYDGFSVVRTAAADKVIAQGLAMYEASSLALSTIATKKNYVDVYFPDLDNAASKYSLDYVNDNYTLFNIQVTSCLGFFTEVFDSTTDSAYYSTAADFITYARILNETGDINPINYSGTDGYVKFDKWRGNTIATSPFASDTDISNRNISILSSQIVYTGTGDQAFLRLQLDVDIFEGKQTLDELPPVFAINLVQNGANILEGDIQLYESIGHYQKKDTYLTTITSQTDLLLPLVGERWEDCIPEPYGQITFDPDFKSTIVDRYLWIEKPDGTRYRWLNVGKKTEAQITPMLNDISTNGFYLDGRGNKVYGIFSYDVAKESGEGNIGSEHINYTLKFSKSYYSLSSSYSDDLFFPKVGEKVYIIYDNEIPVRFFGGDTFVNECIWAHMDNRWNSTHLSSSDPLQRISVSFPYTYYRIPVSHVGFSDSHLFAEYTSAGGVTYGGLIRQHINMWTAETRSCLALSFGLTTDTTLNDLNVSYPLKNYVPRGTSWIGDETSASFPTNNPTIPSTYFTKYGAENIYWKRGGFKYKQIVNKDYSLGNNILALTSVPAINFTEQTHYPTMIVWSKTKPVNSQNSQSVKTFPIANQHTISDDTGEIKFGWNALSEGKGFNLYAFTDSGIALLLTDKNIISQQNATELFTANLDLVGVTGDVWINRSIGMNNDMWRTWAEYSNMLFFVNNTSMYAFTDNNLINLAEGTFMELYNNRFLEDIDKPVGFPMRIAGGYDALHKEYWITMSEDFSDEETKSPTLMYGVNQKALQCRSDYKYEKYLTINNKMYGMKKGVTYKIGEGYVLDGENLRSYVTGVSAGAAGRYDADALYTSKEFIRIKVNSNIKPTKIYFFDDYAKYLADDYSSVVDSSVLSYSIKDYGQGYECYIPRKAVAPHLRQQGKMVIYKIEHDDAEDFLVNVAMVQFKELK